MDMTWVTDRICGRITDGQKIRIRSFSIHKGEIGKGTDPDFLAISYSSTDAVGHWYGPFSKEIKDTYLRLDKDLERLIQTLDQTIGRENYVLFMTADHGIPEIPRKDIKVPGGYLN